ncbi:hypothetical protein JHN55_03820 [Streptomyces sp. MBT56]|nr:hypothetical protein [Streptomyces sp. MBT56]MBK3602396.1 hypothetical protein [Streptomyces sp. MBT54]MBK3617299.1 hypothetical protein [Streptomyces sp. MBT98]
MSAATGHRPLHDPSQYEYGDRPVAVALQCAREALAKRADENIYDQGAMIASAVSLEICLFDLVAALDREAER